MEQSSQPDIASFVLRFVQEPNQNPENAEDYRGFVRHVQSNEEFAFTQWKDAVNFIRQFVPIEC